MKLNKQLERKLSRFAIRDLTLYLAGGQGIALILGIAQPEFLGAMLLVPSEVADGGQWWRLLSFVFTPPAGSPIFALFALYLLFFMGRSLEAQWGELRFNLFVLIGFLMTIAAAFAFPYSVASNTFITGSIFLAFAWLFPDYTLMLFFVLPVKVKWLALLTWLFYGYTLITGGWAERLLVLAAVANFLLFFSQDIYARARYGHRKLKQHSVVIAARDKPLHICTVCGITDKTDRTMDFRYCTKCEPPVAYCSEHLRTHAHLRPETVH
jgi:hypothetical protein